MTSTIVEPRDIAPDRNERKSPRRKTVLAASLIAVIGVIAVLVGIVFPGMFAAAIAVAVVALIVLLERVLGPREQQEAPLGYWTF